MKQLHHLYNLHKRPRYSSCLGSPLLHILRLHSLTPQFPALSFTNKISPFSHFPFSHFPILISCSCLLLARLTVCESVCDGGFNLSCKQANRKLILLFYFPSCFLNNPKFQYFLQLFSQAIIYDTIFLFNLTKNPE